MKTRGSLVAVWGHNGTVVHVYVYERDPCIWMASSPLIWPKRGNDHVHFRFWSNGVGNCEA